jgi:hypothetical protein
MHGAGRASPSSTDVDISALGRHPNSRPIELSKIGIKAGHWRATYRIACACWKMSNVITFPAGSKLPRSHHGTVVPTAIEFWWYNFERPEDGTILVKARQASWTSNNRFIYLSRTKNTNVLESWVPECSSVKGIYRTGRSSR